MNSAQCTSINTDAIEKEANLSFVNIKVEPQLIVDEVLVSSTHGLSGFYDASPIRALNIVKIEPEENSVTVDEAILHLNGGMHKYKDENEEKGCVEILLKKDIKIEHVFFEDKGYKITDCGAENAYTRKEEQDLGEAFEEKRKIVIKSETEICDISSLYCPDASSMLTFGNKEELNACTNTAVNEKLDNPKSTEETKPLSYVKEEDEIAIEYEIIDQKNPVKNVTADGKQ